MVKAEKLTGPGLGGTWQWNWESRTARSVMKRAAACFMSASETAGRMAGTERDGCSAGAVSCSRGWVADSVLTGFFICIGGSKAEGARRKSRN